MTHGLFWGLVGIVFLPSTSYAALLTFTYHGVITTASANYGANQEDFDPFLGKPVQFSVTFETDPLLNPDTDPVSTIGNYQLRSLTATVMGNSWTATHGRVMVQNNHTQTPEITLDVFLGEAPFCTSGGGCAERYISGPEVGGLPLASLSFGFGDSSLAALSSDALPVVQPDPAHYSVQPEIGDSSYVQLVFFNQSIGATPPFPLAQLIADNNIQKGEIPQQFFEYELWMQAQTSLDLGSFAIEGRIVNTGTLPLRLPYQGGSIGSWPGNPGVTVSCDLSCLSDELESHGILEPGESITFNWISGTITEDVSSFAGIFFEGFLCVLPVDLGWDCHGAESISPRLAQSQWVTGPADSSLPFNKKVYNLGTLGPIINFPYKKTTHDLNDDGKADLLWRNTLTGVVAGWLMNGSTISSFEFLGGVPAEWKMEAIGDVDGDRQADVIWKNSNSHIVAVWLMNGLSIRSVRFLDGLSSEWEIAGIGDVSGDGKEDLVWRNKNSGQVAVWLMNGGNTAFSAFLVGVPLDWEIAAVGDVDGDAKADLVWRNTTSGSIAIWFMNGVTVNSVGFLGVTLLTPEQKIKGLGDVNGDGKTDIIWQDGHSHVVAVWLMNGTSILSTAHLGGVPVEWKIDQVADVNGDGKSDVIWQHTNGTVAVWLINGTRIESVGFPGGVSPEWDLQP